VTWNVPKLTLVEAFYQRPKNCVTWDVPKLTLVSRPFVAKCAGG